MAACPSPMFIVSDNELFEKRAKESEAVMRPIFENAKKDPFYRQMLETGTAKAVITFKSDDDRN